MQIWVDVDVCFGVIKEIIFCVVECLKISIMLVVNQMLCILLLCYICVIQVLFGFDVVDVYIIGQVEVGDLVIIVDILFVFVIIGWKVYVLNLCGELYIFVNIQECLIMCNFMEELCNVGVEIGGLVVFG